MEEEDQDRINLYQSTIKKYSEKLDEAEGREKEEIEFRIESCRSLIEQIYEKENPTKKKEMYK